MDAGALCMYGHDASDAVPAVMLIAGGTPACAECVADVGECDVCGGRGEHGDGCSAAPAPLCFCGAMVTVDRRGRPLDVCRGCWLAEKGDRAYDEAKDEGRLRR